MRAAWQEALCCDLEFGMQTNHSMPNAHQKHGSATTSKKNTVAIRYY